MNVTELLARFNSCKKISSGYKAKCPAHDDRTPSLSINEAADGKILLTCHAGCDTESILASVGLSMKDLFPEKPESSVLPRRAQQIVATYDYTDEQGELLYQVARFHPKDFRQRRLDKAGKWVWNLGNVKRVPYRLAQLVSAEPNVVVFIVEGEKDVDLLVSHGLVATTNVSGAKKWRDYYSDYLIARNVVVIPDNDDAGREHALNVAGSLHGKAASIRIVELPGLPPKGDVSDFLNAGYTVDQLLAITDRTADWTPTLTLHTEVSVPDAKPVDTYHLTDAGNAQRLVALHGRDLRYCYAWRKWLIWNGQMWKADDTGEIIRRAKATVQAIYSEASSISDEHKRKEIARWAMKSESEQHIRGMVDLAKSEDGIPVTSDEFDADGWLLNVQNGTIELKTGRLREHRREDLITKLAPVTFSPDAVCPTFDAFLSRIMSGNSSLIEFLQKGIGYSLTGEVSEQVLPICYGLGANGKTTLLELFTDLLGDYAMPTPIEGLMLKRGDSIPNDIARLKGARFVSAVEVEEGKRLSESRVKQLTGGDRISARFMRAEWFDFRPSFKLWLAVNHRPVIRGTDNGIWRRIRLIPFEVSIPEPEQDKRLPEKLRAEMSGILRWAVEGCLMWQREGLGNPEQVKAATASYRDEMDVLGDFLTGCCIRGEGLKVQSSALYEAYKKWCADNGEPQLGSKNFTRRMKERGERVGHGPRGSMFQGIGLLAPNVTDDSLLIDDTSNARFPMNETISNLHEGIRNQMSQVSPVTPLSSVTNSVDYGCERCDQPVIFEGIHGYCEGCGQYYAAV